MLFPRADLVLMLSATLFLPRPGAHHESPSTATANRINLSQPPPEVNILPLEMGYKPAQLLALTHLYIEYEQRHSRSQESSLVTAAQIARLPPSKREQLTRDLLTIRPPTSLPSNVLSAIDTILSHRSARSPDRLVPVSEVPTLSALFPSLTSDELPSTFSRLSFWRGDITRLSSPTAAIVNPANTAMLGCFLPSHLCADNVIHAAAGPRLRIDCTTIMDGREAEEGEPILTRGWSLPSGYVLHVAGPKLERGAAPTEEEDELLAASYRNSLDLAEELGGIDAVAFPCISTGLFAFPGSAASIIALRTVNAWIDSHPESPTRAIFVLFSAADANHYLAATSHLFPSLPTPLPLTPHVALSPKVLEWMKESDAVIIHAGAGLSGNAVRADLGMGLDYNSKELFKTLYPDLLKTTDNLTTLYHSIGYGFDDPLVRWAFLLAHAHTATTWGPTPVYTSLLNFALSKSSYTVLTSNADNVFVQSGFDRAQAWTPQGSYSYFQCMNGPCSPTFFFPSMPALERARPFLKPDAMRIPEDRLDLIPSCPNCGGEVFLNLRMGNFLETPQMGQRERYERQVEEAVVAARAKGSFVLLLELGVRFNTPSVVRWPGEQLVEQYGGIVKLLRINLGHPEVPVGLGENALGVRMGARDFFETLGLEWRRKAGMEAKG